MKFPLATYARRAGLRRREVTFSPIITTKAQANDLAAIYNRMLAPWYGARDRITEAYARELDRVLQTDSIDDLSNLMDELGREVQRLVLTLTPALQDWAFRVETWHRGKWARTVLAGTGVNIETLIGPQDAQETIQAFMGRNVALVKDISAQAQGRISDAVFRGFQQRTPAREVGREIAEALGMARRRAVRVAADQAIKLSSALDAERQRQAGLTVWKWRHSGKLHPRQNHKARDGNLYADVPGDRGTLASGAVVREPPEFAPGVEPYCGCVRVGVLVLEGEVL